MQYYIKQTSLGRLIKHRVPLPGIQLFAKRKQQQSAYSGSTQKGHKIHKMQLYRHYQQEILYIINIIEQEKPLFLVNSPELIQINV